MTRFSSKCTCSIACLHSRVLLVLLVLQVLLELGVLLVPKVHEVTKVKLVNVALMASKDIEDSLAIQVPQVLPVLLDTRVQLVVQALQVPEAQLVHMDLLEKMDQVDIQVPLDHQGLEVTEVKEDLRARPVTLDSQDPLDPLVPLVPAVVAVLLLLELEVKSLAAFHHITGMIQWISRSTLRRSCLHSSLLTDK